MPSSLSSARSRLAAVTIKRTPVAPNGWPNDNELKTDVAGYDGRIENPHARERSTLGVIYPPQLLMLSIGKRPTGEARALTVQNSGESNAFKLAKTFCEEKYFLKENKYRVRTKDNEKTAANNMNYLAGKRLVNLPNADIANAQLVSM